MKLILATIAILSLTFTTFSQATLQPLRVGITVSNIDRASAWYEKNLGFITYKKMQFPEYDSLYIHFLKQGEFEIELVSKKTMLSIQKLRPGYDMNKEPLQGFIKLVFTSNDIQALFQKLQQNGVKEVLGITHDKEFNVDFFLIEDMDGNLLQFIQMKKV